MFLYKKGDHQNTDLANLDQAEIADYLMKHADDLDDGHLELLQPQITNADMLELDESDLKSVMDEYLYQIEPELN